jgi:hypothetical protein
LPAASALNREAPIVTIFVKDPGATIDYTIDWSAGYLGAQAISTSNWVVEPAGIGTIVVEADAIEPGKTVVTLSGGQVGRIYRITNSVSFSDGRTDQRMLALRVEDR